MARICDICGKGVQHGENVSHAYNVTKRRWEVNLQTVRATVQGRPSGSASARCIRTGRVTKSMPQAQAVRARTA